VVDDKKREERCGEEEGRTALARVLSESDAPRVVIPIEEWLTDEHVHH